jgi:hypothetical protein
METDCLIPKVNLHAIDDLCLRLFDRWCECRELLPLSYLLHVWPISDAQAHRLRKMQDTIDELLTSNRTTLSQRDAAELHLLKAHLDPFA